MAATEAHRARITSKGQITVPKTVRERLGVGPGDSLEFAVAEGAERAEVRPVRRRSIAEFRGIFGRGEGPRKVDEPFDWTAQRTRAWKAATARLTPPRGGGATSGGGGRGASGSRRG